MSDYKSIEAKILSADQVLLQRIVSHIVDGEYNYPSNFIYLGEAVVDSKTRWGTPDVFFQLSSGHFVFIEVTSQKTAVYKKILDDLKKCKKEAEDKGIKVKKVIYACLIKPTLEQIKKLQDFCLTFCSNQEVPFELFGIDRIASWLSTKYRNIARDELKIAFPYGTFQTLTEWQENKHDVSQTHDFLYRVEELTQIASLLESSSVVLLYGKAGCGKTRLAARVAQGLEQQGYKAFVVKGALSKTIEDLNSENDGSNLIFILDDVNRIPYLNDFIAYARSNKNIRVLATVREYAFQDIKHNLMINGLTPYVSELRIGLLTREQQEVILKKILPNAEYGLLKTIKNVSQENMRFAVMCADIIKSGKNAPNSIKELMEEHFAIVAKDLESRKEESVDKATKSKYKKCLLILAILNRLVDIDRRYGNGTNELDEMLEKFSLSRADFFDAMNYWDNKEVVNISFNNKVFEIGDQILANYLFYKLVFQEEIASLADIFDKMFPAYRRQIVEVFQSILPVYGYVGIIEERFKKLWEEKYKNDIATKPFIEAFHPLLQAESLKYIKEQVEIGHGKEYIAVLCNFESSNNNIEAIDIIIEILKISGGIADNEFENIVDALSPQIESFNAGLLAQIYLLEKLKGNFHNDFFKKFFLEYAKKLLNFSFSKMKVDGHMTMVHHSFSIIPSEQVYKMRELAWHGLVDLFKVNHGIDKIFSIVRSNGNNPFNKKDKDVGPIIEKDADVIVKLLDDFQAGSFQDKIFVKMLLECVFDGSEEAYKVTIADMEQSDIDFQIYNAIDNIKHKRKYEIEFKEKLITRTIQALKNHTDFISYLGKMSDLEDEQNIISDSFFGSRDLTSAIDAYFAFVDKKYSSEFFTAMKLLFETVPNINCQPNNAIKLALKNCKASVLFELLKSSKLRHKNIWLMSFFLSLKEDEINDAFYNSCLELVQKRFALCNSGDTVRWGNERASALGAFENYKPGFFKSVFKSIHDQYTKGERSDLGFIEDFYYMKQGNLWSYYEFTIEKVEGFFGNDIESLYYELYFALIKKGHFSHGNAFIKYLGNKDIEYVYRYYEILLEDNNQYLKMDLLKSFPNVAQNLLRVIVKHQSSKPWFYFGIRGEKLLNAVLSDENFKTFVDLFVEKYKDDSSAVSTLCNLVNNLKIEWQFSLAEKMIATVDVETFKSLPILDHPSHWSGSDVPMLEGIVKRIDDFLSTLERNSGTQKYIVALEERKNRYKKSVDRARLQELANPWL